MNIHDIKDIPHVESKDYLNVIWERQTSLIKKYREIEGLPAYPLDIDNAEHQVWIKDFLWRIVEEIAEAYEADSMSNNFPHVIEELADALHFMVEIMILCGVEPRSWDLTEIVEEIVGDEVRMPFHNSCFSVCYRAGLTGNTLKNKKWKQTHMQTDANKFTALLQTTFDKVIGVFVSMHVSADEIFICYFKKSEVNEFRIRTNY